MVAGPGGYLYVHGVLHSFHRWKRVGNLPGIRLQCGQPASAVADWPRTVRPEEDPFSSPPSPGLGGFLACAESLASAARQFVPSAITRGFLRMARLVIQGSEIQASRLQPTDRGAGLLADDLITGQKVSFRLTVATLAQERASQPELRDAGVQVIGGKRLCEACDYFPE